MAIKTDRLIPNNISDLGMLDEDSGLRMFRGMITPWDQIKSFRETCHFLWRHSAIMGVAYMNALKIVEVDSFLNNFYSQYPEFADAYRAYFDAIAKTLVDCQWVVKLGDAPEGKTRFVIEKGVYGFRRQKPGYTFAEGENKA